MMRTVACFKRAGRYIICAGIILYTSACFRTRHLAYHESCNLYTYRNVPLRLPDRRLVTIANIDTFLMQAQTNYLMQGRMKENDLSISRSDHILVSQYDSVVMAMESKNYAQAIASGEKLKNMYRAVEFYSDISFLQGYAWASLGNRDSARVAFEKFLNYAGQKYPSRFRGLSRTLAARDQYCRERSAAVGYLYHDTLPSLIFQRIAPVFYYQSFSPGYGYNPDDFQTDARWIFSGVGWEYVADQSLFQANTVYMLHPRLGLSTGIRFNQHVQLLCAALPWQATWATNRRWGVKLTPLLFFAHSNHTDRYRLIPMAGMSVGYHFHPRYYAGFSAGFPFVHPDEWQPYFESFQWRVSLNAHIVKNLSASVAYSPHTVVTGITVSNTLLGYDWGSRRVVLILQIF